MSVISTTSISLLAILFRYVSFIISHQNYEKSLSHHFVQKITELYQLRSFGETYWDKYNFRSFHLLHTAFFRQKYGVICFSLANFSQIKCQFHLWRVYTSIAVVLNCQRLWIDNFITRQLCKTSPATLQRKMLRFRMNDTSFYWLNLYWW